MPRPPRSSSSSFSSWSASSRCACFARTSPTCPDAEHRSEQREIDMANEALEPAAAPPRAKYQAVGGACGDDSVLPGLLLFLVVLFSLSPCYWALRAALSTQRELRANPESLLPVGFTLDNFKAALGMISSSDAVASGGSGRTFEF